jgi:hypothetical protein
MRRPRADRGENHRAGRDIRFVGRRACHSTRDQRTASSQCPVLLPTYRISSSVYAWPGLTSIRSSARGARVSRHAPCWSPRRDLARASSAAAPPAASPKGRGCCGGSATSATSPAGRSTTPTAKRSSGCGGTSRSRRARRPPANPGLWQTGLIPPSGENEAAVRRGRRATAGSSTARLAARKPWRRRSTTPARSRAFPPCRRSPGRRRSNPRSPPASRRSRPPSRPRTCRSTPAAGTLGGLAARAHDDRVFEALEAGDG